MRRKTVLNSSRVIKIKKEKRRSWRKRFYIFLVLLILIFVGLSFASHINSLNITSITVSGNKVIDDEGIIDVVDKNISGRYFFIFPKTNLLIFPRKNIKEELFDTYTRLNKIELNLAELELEVFVSERDAYYTWCGEDLPSQGVELEQVKCYFTDELGFVFDEAPYFSGDVYFRFYGPLEGGHPASVQLRLRKTRLRRRRNGRQLPPCEN